MKTILKISNIYQERNFDIWGLGETFIMEPSFFPCILEFNWAIFLSTGIIVFVFAFSTLRVT